MLLRGSQAEAALCPSTAGPLGEGGCSLLWFETVVEKHLAKHTAS